MKAYDFNTQYVIECDESVKEALHDDLVTALCEACDKHGAELGGWSNLKEIVDSDERHIQDKDKDEGEAQAE